MADLNKIKECECDANLFYKKYKTKIELLFTDTFGVGDSTQVQCSGVQLQSYNLSASRFAKAEGDGGSMDKMVRMHLAAQELDYSKGGQLGKGRSKGGKKQRWGRKGYGYYPFGHGLRANAASQSQYEDSLGLYQKLFDHHLDSLYGIAEGGEYFKGRQSEHEDDESLDYTEKFTDPWMSESQRKAEGYFKMHKIHELFQFLGSHLCASNPGNPIDFLITLLDKCLKYRCGFMDPPLLFTFRHVESLFQSMDPMSIGVIDLEQYYTAMKTLGVKYFEKFPRLNHNGYVTKKIFIDEALMQLQIELDEMIQNFSSLSRVHYTIAPTISAVEVEGVYDEEDEDSDYTQYLSIPSSSSIS